MSLAATGVTAAAALETCAPDDGGTHRVAEIIDGETVVLDDGREVRLMGALAPRPNSLSRATEAWKPAQDAKQALGTLLLDHAVALRFEGRRQDRYGRLLAQLAVAAPDGTVWVQERMVRAGHARAYTLPGSGACLGRLLIAEAEARATRSGLWGSGIYATHAAHDVDALLRLTGRFVVVEGTVRAVARTRETTYVNFGADWRNDFTASLATATVDGSTDGVRRVEGLKDRKVRVRGWVERRNGPMVVLSSLDEIEPIDPAASPP